MEHFSQNLMATDIRVGLMIFDVTYSPLCYKIVAFRRICGFETRISERFAYFSMGSFNDYVMSRNSTELCRSGRAPVHVRSKCVTSVISQPVVLFN